MKIISFCLENINELKTLKESNVNEFIMSFISQINFVNHSIQEELKENMENVISMLDMFFKRDFTERKKDLKEIDKFMENIGKVKDGLINLLNENKNKINSMENSYKENIMKSLNEKKTKLEKLLSKKKLWRNFRRNK